ncbi:hypothetical protein [Paludisphaera soli]|uniref:hypothetical protein n=1 Tax=Paludisphaera soli TaxID=2712865 RepID=UPI0013ED6A5A|nr:hypothetical protein [Paludisphaera soli]
MPAFAGGGNVLPPTAKPKGHSLADLAGETGIFNASGPAARSEANEPEVPFQILYTSDANPSSTFEVRPGTMLYVPVVWSDDSAPILGDFPDVNDPEAVADYYFNPDQLGAEFIEIEVDGNTTALEPEYSVGADVPGLPSGATHYTVAAAVLTPFSKGTHTVTIRARFTGAAIAEFPEFFPGGVFEFSNTYTVIVD